MGSEMCIRDSMISSSVLTRSCPLEILNLSCNKIGDHPEAEFSIEVFLSNDRNSLTQLDLSYNELGATTIDIV